MCLEIVRPRNVALLVLLYVALLISVGSIAYSLASGTTTREVSKTSADGAIEKTSEVVTEGRIKNFATLFGVGIAAISGLFAFGFSVFTVYQNNRQQTHLQTLTITLPGRIEAYTHLWQAALGYYRELALLDSGRWNRRCFDNAETVMTKAEGSGIYVAPSHLELWRDFWDKAHFLGERANNLTDSATQAEYWRMNVKNLADCLEDFETVAQLELKSPNID